MTRITRKIIPLLGMSFLLIAGIQESFAQSFGGMGGMGGTGRSSSRSSFGSSGSSSTQRYYYSNGMIGDAIIEADRDTRSIIVITDEYTNDHIKEVIESLDRPVQQVLIKVAFIEITYNDTVDLGVEGSLDINNNNPGSNVFKTAYGLAAESRGGFYTLLEKDVNITLRAISEAGHTKVLSRPSILTRNNQEAVMTVGKEVPLITNSRVTSDGQTINTVEYQDIGIILRVTPFITQEGLVEMILAPEISTITEETVPISDTINSPVFAKRSADTVVVTPNGQTVVIGGMMEDNNTEVVKKVPFLGDIPLLGMAFRRTEKDTTKTELLIFLTPYVVEGPSNLVEMTEKEKTKSQLLPQSFSEDQLNRYLDQQPASTVENATPETVEAPKTEKTPKLETSASSKSEEKKKNTRVRGSKGHPLQ